MGGNVFWGEGITGEMNRGRGVEERNYSSLKGITLVPSMSSTQRCSQILSRGYLLTLPVRQSISHCVCLHLFFSQRWKKPLSFSTALCFCFGLSGSLLLPHIVFLWLFYGLRSITLKIKQEINSRAAGAFNYMQRCCPLPDTADYPGSGPLR